MAEASTTWAAAGRDSAALEVHLLGLVDFESALFLQERLLYEISGREDRQGQLLLCEHPPLVTIGREGSRSHLLADSDELLARQIEVRWVNRGGGCLMHAPGQLAVYPIVPLDRLGLGLAEYRDRLEESVVDVCRELRVPTYRRGEAPGVWCRQGQVAHLGVAVKSWVAYHGLFLNVCPVMELLRMVRPTRSADIVGQTFRSAERERRGREEGGRQECLPHEAVASLAVQRVRPTSMHAARESMIRNLAVRLGYERVHLYTGHPLLRRTRRRVYVGA